MLGGILGGAIGVLGGALGTYLSIRNTREARERAFVIKASIPCWALIVAFVAAMFLLPSPQRYFLWLPYAVPLTLQILFVQIVAIPAVMIVWSLAPNYTPVAFAAVVGVTFFRTSGSIARGYTVFWGSPWQVGRIWWGRCPVRRRFTTRDSS